MIACQGKQNPQQLPRNGYQSLYLRHSSLKIPLIRGVHHAPFTNRIDRCKIEEFSQKRTPHLRDMPIPLVLARADLKQIQPRQFHHFPEGAKLTETSYFSDQTGHCNLSNPFHRKKRITVRDLFKIGNHLFFHFLNKTLAGLKTRKNLLHLQKNPPSALLETHRLHRCVIKCLSAFFSQLPSTD